jgi:hypothetical protein
MRTYVVELKLGELCIAVAVALGPAVAADTTRAAPSAAAKPKWLVLTGFWPRGSGTEVAGSASGRGWLGFVNGDGESRSTILGSLRQVGSRLSFAKTVLAASRGPEMIVGEQLFYHLPSSSGELRSVSLVASGGVGMPTAVPDDPERIAPQQYHPIVHDGIEVGDRLVWVLTGSRGGTRLDFLWACCSRTGALSDLSRLISHRRVMSFLQLGRDNKGRLWLAWLDVQLQKVWGGVRMVELDPDTLSPRTANTFGAPAPDSWLRPQLVCADLCRVVMGDLGGDIFTWAPGERSPTRMRSGTRQLPATLLDASFRSGNLVVASAKTLRLRRPPWSMEQIAIVRGDDRGARSSCGLGRAGPVRTDEPFPVATPDPRELRVRRPRLLQEVLQLPSSEPNAPHCRLLAARSLGRLRTRGEETHAHGSRDSVRVDGSM